VNHHGPTTPCVWSPWTYQLLFLDVAAQSVDLDFVSLQPCRIRVTTVAAGTPFTVRLQATVRSHTAELAVLARSTPARCGRAALTPDRFDLAHAQRPSHSGPRQPGP